MYPASSETGEAVELTCMKQDEFDSLVQSDWTEVRVPRRYGALTPEMQIPDRFLAR